LQVEITLQPWRAFKPDGVVLFSDILTPLAGMNIGFDFNSKGPVITDPIRTMEVRTTAWCMRGSLDAWRPGDYIKMPKSASGFQLQSCSDNWMTLRLEDETIIDHFAEKGTPNTCSPRATTLLSRGQTLA
jgi:hypothetical protein